MRSIARRVTSLEDYRRAREGSFAHLDNAALHVLAIDLIQQAEAAGVPLPGDWRDQYDADAGGFMTWVAHQVGEIDECEI